MRCVSCDEVLSDYEATRKNLNNEFITLCNNCLSESDLDNVLFLDRPDLRHHTDDLRTFNDEGIVEYTLDIEHDREDSDGNWDE